MTIDELIQRLTKIRAVHGNLPVSAQQYGLMSKIVVLAVDRPNLKPGDGTAEIVFLS